MAETARSTVTNHGTDDPVGNPPESSPAQVRRAALSSFIGTAVEFYDFLLYGAAAAVVFSKLFFPELSPGWATAASFATFAAGYVARLVGGLVFAHFGDLAGRKSVLLTTMLLMGVATGAIGLLPTYEQIGVLAPVLLVLLRVVQGIAAGGEYGGAALMSAEHAPKHRRGLVGTSTSLGLPVGGLLATAMFAAASSLPEPAFLSWGWRIPFLVGFILVGIGLWVRLKVDETPVFAAAQAASSKSSSRLPMATMFKRHPRSAVLGILLVMPTLAISSLFGSYIVSYAISVGFKPSQGLISVIIGSVVAIVTLPVYGALSDRFGRRPIFLIGTVGTVVLAYPCFALVNSGSLTGLFLAQAIMIGLVSTAMSGPMVALLSEMFDTDVRYTGVAMVYQTGTLVAGGFSPLIAAVLAASASDSSDSGRIALMLIVLGVLGTVAIVLSPESRGRDLTRPAAERSTTATTAS
ncbi:MFS transporter [Rhodococcus koreensis]